MIEVWWPPADLQHMGTNVPTLLRNVFFEPQPITIMRNALGRDEGGSGVKLEREAYEASAAYWAERAAVVAGKQPSGE